MTRVLTSLALLAALAIGSTQSSSSTMTAQALSQSSEALPIALDAPAAPRTLSTSQTELLKNAFRIARADGHSDPSIVQMVLLQETQAGAARSYRVSRAGSASFYGLMQIQLSTAKEVLRRYPGLFARYGLHTRSDDEIKAFLILNEMFNIEVGSKYLRMLEKQYGYVGRELLNAYNRGPSGVKDVDESFPYAIQAEQKLETIRSSKS